LKGKLDSPDIEFEIVLFEAVSSNFSGDRQAIVDRPGRYGLFSCYDPVLAEQRGSPAC
jgi:hypothetical protein